MNECNRTSNNFGLNKTDNLKEQLARRSDFILGSSVKLNFITVTLIIIANINLTLIIF